MPDNLIYQAMAGFSIDLAKRAAELIRYRAVFLLAPLAIEHDGIRNLDYTTQHSIHNEIFKKYTELNYEPIVITSTDLRTRLGIIKRYVEEVI